MNAKSTWVDKLLCEGDAPCLAQDALQSWTRSALVATDMRLGPQPRVWIEVAHTLAWLPVAVEAWRWGGAVALMPADTVVSARTAFAPTHLWRAGALTELRRDRPTEETADAVLWLSTSGTTGAPKLLGFVPAALEAAARLPAKLLDLTPATHWVSPLAACHAGGLMPLFRAGLAGGRWLSLPARPFDAEAFHAHCETSAVTHASVVPLQLMRLVESGRPPWPTLRHVVVSGAASSGTLKRAAYDAGWPCIYAYGQTESLGMLATACGTQASANLLPEVEVAGDASLRWLRSPSAATYCLAWHDGGYVDTGPPKPGADDHLGLDETGLRVLGRRDDAITRAGETLAPAMIEAELARRGVSFALTALGVTDERLGQAVALLVWLPPERSAEVYARLSALPRALRPDLVAFAGPRTEAQGLKLSRRQLSQRFAGAFLRLPVSQP